MDDKEYTMVHGKITEAYRSGDLKKEEFEPAHQAVWAQYVKDNLGGNYTDNGASTEAAVDCETVLNATNELLEKP